MTSRMDSSWTDGDLITMLRRRLRRGRGRPVDDLQDGLELNRLGPDNDVEEEVEDRLDGRTSRTSGTPPSSPRLREVRVVRGMRRRLGSSL